jgi:hypothetical protein
MLQRLKSEREFKLIQSKYICTLNTNNTNTNRGVMGFFKDNLLFLFITSIIFKGYMQKPYGKTYILKFQRKRNFFYIKSNNIHVYTKVFGMTIF